MRDPASATECATCRRASAGAARRAAPVFSLALAALACASAPSQRGGAPIPAERLLSGSSLGVAPPAAELVAPGEVLAVSDAMRAFLGRHVDRGADSQLKLWQLSRAITDEDAFGLEYDETTRSAASTFRARRGNCLSFSNMFVAMARDLGLEAHYQEVDTPPDWTLRKDAFVLNRHVNVLVDLGTGGERVVDFNVGDFRASYERRRISDARALAHHYNNLAVERMQAGDTAAALGYFRRSVGSDPRFSPAWTNLATLYLREGRAEHAEAGYLRALSADGRDLVAMSNLARLYEQRGDLERAESYRKKVQRHRKRNPYYRLWLARAALEAGQYDAAIGHLEYAVRRKRDEAELYLLLGMSYLEKGDRPEAGRWLARAEKVSSRAVLERRFPGEMEVLLAAQERDDPGG